MYYVGVLHGHVRNFFIEIPDTQRTERQGERGIWVAMSCYLFHVIPLQLPPSPHRASVAPPAARSWQPRSKSRTASI